MLRLLQRPVLRRKQPMVCFHPRACFLSFCNPVFFLFLNGHLAQQTPDPSSDPHRSYISPHRCSAFPRWQLTASSSFQRSFVCRPPLFFRANLFQTTINSSSGSTRSFVRLSSSGQLWLRSAPGLFTAMPALLLCFSLLQFSNLSEYGLLRVPFPQLSLTPLSCQRSFGWPAVNDKGCSFAYSLQPFAYVTLPSSFLS